MTKTLSPGTPENLAQRLADVRDQAGRVVLGRDFLLASDHNDFSAEHLGLLLGHAALRSDADSVKAIAWLYANLHQSYRMDRVLAGALDVLIEENRTELFAPIVVRFHQACTTLWRIQQAQRADLPDELAGGLFPDLSALNDETTQDIHGPWRSSGTQGLAAWLDVGRDLLAISAQWNTNLVVNSWNRTRLVVAQTLRDSIALLPDARGWATQILYDFMGTGRGESPDVRQARLEVLADMANVLTDRGACVWARSVADEIIDPYHPQGDQRTPAFGCVGLAQKLVRDRPHITLDQWLTWGTTGDLDTKRMRGRTGYANEVVRSELGRAADNGVLPARLTADQKVLRSVPESGRAAPPILIAYESLIRWVGPDQGCTLRPGTAQVIEAVLRDVALVGSGPHEPISATATQAAVDLYQLRRSGGMHSDPDGEQSVAPTTRPRRI